MPTSPWPRLPGKIPPSTKGLDGMGMGRCHDLRSRFLVRLCSWRRFLSFSRDRVGRIGSEGDALKLTPGVGLRVVGAECQPILD